ncbi:MAG: hypothetical protein ACXVKH_16760 [Candidatus Angelobacter sp.]
MDPVKVVIFVAAFLGLLLLGRKLSATEEVHGAGRPLPPPTPEMLPGREEYIEQDSGVAVVGADLPFPVRLPELEQGDDGKYNRPEFLNYHFSKIDLLRGPADPKCFFDEFFVETRNPQDEHVGTYKFLVATPAGMQRAMDEERQSLLYLEEHAIIVDHWDLTLMLNAAVQEIIKTYQGWQTYSDEHALPETNGPT